MMSAPQGWTCTSVNINTKMIPLFAVSTDTTDRTMFPMCGDLGPGYGSVSLMLKTDYPQIDSIAVKIYPKLLHYLKSHNINMNLAGILRGMKNNMGKNKELVTHTYKEGAQRIVCEYRYEYVMKCRQSIVYCRGIGTPLESAFISQRRYISKPYMLTISIKTFYNIHQSFVGSYITGYVSLLLQLVLGFAWDLCNNNLLLL